MNETTNSQSMSDAPELQTTEYLPDFRPMSDDLTLDQAFSMARSEMGPGASFSWHGDVYGTYTRNEWNAMSPEDQQTFTSAAFEARDVYEVPSEPLLAEVEFDDVTEVTVLGAEDSIDLIDSDSTVFIDVQDADLDDFVIDDGGLL